MAGYEIWEKLLYDMLLYYPSTQSRLSEANRWMKRIKTSPCFLHRDTAI